MKKNYFFLATAALGVMSLASCSQDELVIDNSGTPSVGVEEPAEFHANSARLVDANGNEVSSFSDKFNKCFLEIKSAGAWSIENDNAFVYVGRQMGYGDALVPVQVGLNWNQARNFVLNVEFDEATTRAGDSNNTQVSAKQDASSDLAAVKDRISSNLFVGYGYTPGKSAQAEFCTNIQIFKFDDIESKSVFKDDLFESSYQQYMESDSQEDLDRKISISANAAGSFSKFGLKGSGSGSNNSKEKKAEACVQKTLVHTHFTREIMYENFMSSTTGFVEDLLTPGFLYYKKSFEKALANTNKKEDSIKVIKDFVDVVGSHFVKKSSLGYELDYRMSVDSTNIEGSVTANAVLNCKFQSVVKPEEEKKDTLPNGDYSKFKKYTVKLDAKNKDADAVSTTVNPIDKEFTLPKKDPVYADHIFLGWYWGDKKIPKDYDVRKLLTKDEDVIELEGKWKDAPKKSTTGGTTDGTTEEEQRTEIELGASVQYSDSVKEVASKIEAQVRLRGGDVSKVNILVTGGQLESSQVSEWLLSIEPKRATMVDVEIKPIYELFEIFSKTYNALKEYIDENYPTPKAEEQKPETPQGQNPETPDANNTK